MTPCWRRKKRPLDRGAWTGRKIKSGVDRRPPAAAADTTVDKMLTPLLRLVFHDIHAEGREKIAQHVTPRCLLARKRNFGEGRFQDADVLILGKHVRMLLLCRRDVYTLDSHGCTAASATPAYTNGRSYGSRCTLCLAHFQRAEGETGIGSSLQQRVSEDAAGTMTCLRRIGTTI